MGTLATDQSIPLTETPVREIEGHTRDIFAVAFSPDGLRIASGSTDKTVRLSETETGKNLRVFQGHTDLITSVAFSPDGGVVASASPDRR